MIIARNAWLLMWFSPSEEKCDFDFTTSIIYNNQMFFDNEKKTPRSAYHGLFITRRNRGVTTTTVANMTNFDTLYTTV